jgi:hypothetical protein
MSIDSGASKKKPTLKVGFFFVMDMATSTEDQRLRPGGVCENFLAELLVIAGLTDSTSGASSGPISLATIWKA